MTEPLEESEVTEPLIVAVAQPPCAPHDVAANARAHAEAVRDTRARVVVFPELSLTGYELDAAPVDPADPRLAPLTEACAETGTIALAGAPVAEGQATYIAVLALDGAGVTVAYRKMWLGDEEAARFSPGPEPAKITVDGWRLGLAVCKDTGVPRHAADTAALGIDAYLAGTVKHAERGGTAARAGPPHRGRAPALGGGGQLRRAHRRRLRPDCWAVRDLGSRRGPDHRDRVRFRGSHDRNLR